MSIVQVVNLNALQISRKNSANLSLMPIGEKNVMKCNETLSAKMLACHNLNANMVRQSAGK